MALHRIRPATRTALVEDTGLNAASVSRGLQVLLDAGLAVKTGELDSIGGRRSETLSLNPEAGYFVAVDLEGTRVRCARTDMLGDVQRMWEAPVRPEKGISLTQVHRGIESVLSGLTSAAARRVLAIGVSFPGLVDSSGRLTAVNLHWKDVPLEEELARRHGLPVYLEQDSVTGIRAEQVDGPAAGARNWIYLLAGNGVGVGLVIDGRYVHGGRGMAGEMGHVVIEPEAADLCQCGNRGCLEAITSSPNIVRQYIERTGRRPMAAEVTEVFSRARQADPAAVEVIDRVGRAFGLALSHAVSILNPELILLTGDIVGAADLIIPRIQRELAQRTLPQLLDNLTLCASRLGPDVRLRGAATLAFDRIVNGPDWLPQLCRKGTGFAGGDSIIPRSQQASRRSLRRSHRDGGRSR